jgi:hypothetical protein
MLSHRFHLILFLSAFGCDNQSRGEDAATCVLRAESAPDSEIWILPTYDEAGRLDSAIKNRQQATVNLLLEKYHSGRVPAGTECERLEAKDGFVKVSIRAGALTGWVSEEQLGGQ